MTHYSTEASNPEYKGAPLPNSLESDELFASASPNIKRESAFASLGESGSGGGLLRAFAHDAAEIMLMPVSYLHDEETEDPDKVKLRDAWIDRRKNDLIALVQEFEDRNSGLLNLSAEKLPVVSEDQRARLFAEMMIFDERDAIVEARVEARRKSELAKTAVTKLITTSEVPISSPVAELSSVTEAIEVPHVETNEKDLKKFKRVIKRLIPKTALDAIGIFAPASANIDVVRPAPLSPIEYR